MIGYVTIGTSDMEQAKDFWTKLLEPLGAKLVMDMGRIALLGNGPEQPMLAVCIPYDEQPAQQGNGNMVAFPVATRAEVDAQHARAMELGATDEGAPGERMPTFYGGYIRDPDGNKAVFYNTG